MSDAYVPYWQSERLAEIADASELHGFTPAEAQHETDAERNERRIAYWDAMADELEKVSPRPGRDDWDSKLQGWR